MPVARASSRELGRHPSPDGRTWSRWDPVLLPDGAMRRARGVRTPLGLVPLSAGGHRVDLTGFAVDSDWLHRRACVGPVDVEVGTGGP